MGRKWKERKKGKEGRVVTLSASGGNNLTVSKLYKQHYNLDDTPDPLLRPTTVCEREGEREKERKK